MKLVMVRFEILENNFGSDQPRLPNWTVENVVVIPRIGDWITVKDGGGWMLRVKWVGWSPDLIRATIRLGH